MDVNRQLSRVFAVRMLLIKRKHNSVLLAIDKNIGAEAPHNHNLVYELFIT